MKLFINKYFTLWLWLLCLGCPVTHAQGGHGKHAATNVPPTTPTSSIGQRYALKIDSVQQLIYGRCNNDSTLSPYLISIIGSPAPYKAPMQRLFVPNGATHVHNDAPNISKHIASLLPLTDVYLAKACIAYPQLAVDIPKAAELTNDVDDMPITPELTLADKQTNESTPNWLPSLNEDDLGIVVRKPNFWTFKTNFSLQFTQNYVSDNWYKGGESHNALLASTVIEANFNNQRKLTFDNKLEMKLGFQTSHNDEEHKYKTNSDLIRLTNKLGLRAVKHWYYTIMLQSWTQFYKGYKSNDRKVYSDFMSPFESLLSVGMDYQQNSRNNKFRISATLSPLALKLKYVARPSLITSFGLSEPHHSKWEYGSNVTINYTWNIVRNISWTGRIYYFTDYSSTQLEWENTFNLAINRYLSARVFLYPRYDDSRNRTNNQSDFEFNELLSLGLNLNF